jgi:two-component sensor histidine kinase
LAFLKRKQEEAQIAVTVRVRNSGKRKGSVTAQLYLIPPPNHQDLPRRELRGIHKRILDPGEEYTIRFPLSKKDFIMHDRDGNPFLPPGEWRIHMGNASPGGRSVEPAAVAPLEESQRRVHSMMLLYEKLYRREDLSTMPANLYLEPLVQDIIDTSSGHAQVRAETIISPIPLDPDTLSRLGIIINELVGNSLKYAFQRGNEGPGEKGLIQVSLSSEKGRLLLRVADNGKGLSGAIDFENPKSFGFQMVSLLTQRLNGSIRLSREGGTVISISAPLL